MIAKGEMKFKIHLLNGSQVCVELVNNNIQWRKTMIFIFQTKIIADSTAM